jgi:uncharacterized membrane protein YbhN (UPF0104 family)
VRLAGQILLAAGIVFVLLRLREIWGDSHVDVSRVGWWWLGGALAIACAAAVAEGLVWLSILRGLGVGTRRAWAGIYLQAQLGKYVPGVLWQYAGRGALARTHGLPVPLVARSLPVELAAATYAAAVLCALLIGWWGVVVVAAVVALTPFIGSRLRPEWGAIRNGARVTPFYAASTFAIGVSFWMTARSFVDVSAGQIPLYIGGFAAAWIVGLVAIYAPGGLGVREAMLVAILHGRIGSADALVVAAASRGVLTLRDLLAAGAGFLALRRIRLARSNRRADSLVQPFEGSGRDVPAQPLDRE